MLTEYFEKESGAFGLLTEGSKAANAQYVLVAIRSKGKTDDTWSTDSLKIPQDQLAVVLYRKLRRGTRTCRSTWRLPTARRSRARSRF